MKADKVSFYEWQKKFSTDSQCMEHLVQLRWPDGFQCPHCGHDHGYLITTRAQYECSLLNCTFD